MTTKIDDLVARLQQQEAAVGAARKALNENTVQAQAAFHDSEQQLAVVITGLVSVPRDLEAEQALNAALEERRALVLSKLTELHLQLAEAPDWRLAGDGRAREREYERQRGLKQQLERLRAGVLVYAPNQVYARVEDLETKITESNARIEQLRAQLAAHLEQAEALLSEPVSG